MVKALQHEGSTLQDEDMTDDDDDDDSDAMTV